MLFNRVNAKCCKKALAFLVKILHFEKRGERTKMMEYERAYKCERILGKTVTKNESKSSKWEKERGKGKRKREGIEGKRWSGGK